MTTQTLDIIITVDLTDEMIQWYLDQEGGNITTTYYRDLENRPAKVLRLRYGFGKPSGPWFNQQDIRWYTSLHFYPEDSQVALMFILRFANEIVRHNLKDHAICRSE